MHTMTTTISSCDSTSCICMPIYALYLCALIAAFGFILSALLLIAFNVLDGEGGPAIETDYTECSEDYFDEGQCWLLTLR